jgi:hypothetical protein
MEKTMTRPLLFTNEKQAEEAMKNEPILIHRDVSRINYVSEGAKAIIPTLQEVVDLYNAMEVPKITIEDLEQIIDLSNSDSEGSYEKLEAYVIKRASKETPEIDLGKRKISFDAAVKLGIVSFSELPKVWGKADFARKFMHKKVKADSYKWKIISVEDGKVIFNESEFANFSERACSVYARTADEKEKYHLLNTMLECEKQLKEKKYVAEGSQIINPDYLDRVNGELKVKYGRVLNKE